MRVAGQTSEHRLGTCEGCLGVDDPALAPNRLQMAQEGASVGQGAMAPKKLSRPASCRATSRGEDPELADAVWHGLRANAAIQLRQNGRTALQLGDWVEMSPQTVERGRLSCFISKKNGRRTKL